MSQIHRRKLIKQLGAGSLAMTTLPALASTCSSTTSKKTALKNNINHSVCQWTYNFISLEELCKVVKDIGFAAIDLVGPKDWPTLQKYSIYSSMCYHGGKSKSSGDKCKATSVKQGTFVNVLVHLIVGFDCKFF